MSGNSDPSPGTSDWPALPELWNEKVSAITRDHGMVITTCINLDLGRSDFTLFASCWKEFHNQCCATNSNVILTYYYIFVYHTASIN